MDTGWVKVALTNATGDVFIRKIGKHVMMRGSFKTTVSSSITNQLGLVDSLPDEFKSTTTYSRYFVDKYQSITQEQYEQIVAAKQ